DALENVNNLVWLLVVDGQHRGENMRFYARILRLRTEGLHVLGETASAKAGSGPKKGQNTRLDSLAIRKNGTPAFVRMNARHDLVDVDAANRGGHVGQLIDHRDLRGENRVIGILDHLRRARIHPQ